MARSGASAGIMRGEFLGVKKDLGHGAWLNIWDSIGFYARVDFVGLLWRVTIGSAVCHHASKAVKDTLAAYIASCHGIGGSAMRTVYYGSVAIRPAVSCFWHFITIGQKTCS